MRGVQIKFLAKLLFILAVLVGPITASAQKILLLDITNHVWKYQPNITDPGYTPADAWVAPGFDDSGWQSGRGMFGLEPTAMAYPIQTPILNPPGGPQSSYFRARFTYTGNPANVSLLFSNYVDDGIVVYLNGTELYSYNAPVNRPVPWNLLTLPGAANPGGDATPIPPTNVVATTLINGENVIAVQLMQHGSGTSDDVFGMWMYAVIPFAATNQNPLQPANRTILQNRSSVLQVFAAGAPDPTYQWFVGGVAITDATNSTLLVTNDSAIMSTSNFFVRVTNPLGTFDSRTAVVIFDTDVIPPTVVGAVPSADFTTITLQYSEVMESGSVQDAFLYTISGGLTVPADGVLTASGRSVVLTLSAPMAPDTLYTVSVGTSAIDLAGNPLAAGASVQFRSWVRTSAGGLVFEAFNGTPGPNPVGTIAGNAVANLTSHPTYPNNPSEVLLLSAFDTRSDPGYLSDAHEAYGGRVRGLFIPPESGNWILYLSTDDGGELYFNKNGPDAAGKALVAQQPGCCNLFATPGVWTSAPMPLVGGQVYYIEGLFKEGGGGDLLEVAAQLEGVPAPSGGNTAQNSTCANCMPASYVGAGAMPAGAAGTFTITQQPASAQAIAAMPATLSVGVNQSLGLPVLYQWRRNGAPIAGANLSSYTFTPALADSGAQFSVAITNLGGAGQISASATLTVVPDTFAPTIVSSTPAADGTRIVIVYSEGMDSGTAGDAFNYQINGAQVSTATLSNDTVTVVFTSPLTTPCAANVLRISDVTDIAGNPLAPTPATITFTLPLTIVGLTSTWKYNDSGTDLGTAWRQTGFDDSAWASGGSLLGYETNEPAIPPVVTVLSATTATNTAYFRIHFNLATDPRGISRLQLREILDDGAVYYFNGVEAHRTRMPTGTITAATLANAAGPEPTAGTHTVEGPTDIPITGLVYGANVLAVEVHGNALTSSDAVFAAELLATVSTCGPGLDATAVSPGMYRLTWPDPTYQLQMAPTVLGPWTTQVGVVSGTVIPVPATGNGFLRLRKP